MSGPRREDLTGQRLGKAVAIEFVRTTRNRSAIWRFRCDCGTEFERRAGDLRSGVTESCGCVRKASVAAANRKRLRTHGHVNTPAYRSWQAMLTRCRNPKRAVYRYYGGRGVTVCDRWLQFANFLADMGERPAGTTLDRVNPDGHYEPGNCRWANSTVQRTNRRTG